MINLLPYVIGASVVGILHMSAPDHWATLCLLARNKQWTPKKLFRVSFTTALGHVALSIVMGLAVVGVGLVVSHLISYYLDTIIGIIMLAAGLFFGIKPLVKKGRDHHHEHEHYHERDEKEKKGIGKLGGGLSYFIVLGAALSPDPTIIPIYLSAISAGFYFALELSVIFAVASILTLLLFVQLGMLGLGKIFARIPEKYNDSIVGFVIAAIGVYVLVTR
jgi:putative Mn2+ efflux pump MntP